MATETKAEEIAYAILGKIRDGTLKPGDMLPSDRELVRDEKVSLDVARRAAAVLYCGGWITQKGRARRVVRGFSRVEFPQDGLSSLDSVLAGSGRTASEPVVSAGTEQAGQEVAAYLGVEPGTLVAVRRELRRVDGDPHSAYDSFYPRDLVRDSPLMDPVPLAGSEDAVLAGLGVVIARRRDILLSRMPWPDEAARLDVPDGTPLILQYRVRYDPEGKPLLVSVTSWPADRAVLAYEGPG